MKTESETVSAFSHIVACFQTESPLLTCMMPKHLLSSQYPGIKDHSHIKKIKMANNFEIAGVFKMSIYFQDSFPWAVGVLSLMATSVKVIRPQ